MNIGDKVRIKEIYRFGYADWFYNSILTILSIDRESTVKVSIDDTKNWNKFSGVNKFNVYITEIEIIEPNYIEEDE